MLLAQIDLELNGKGKKKKKTNVTFLIKQNNIIHLVPSIQLEGMHKPQNRDSYRKLTIIIFPLQDQEEEFQYRNLFVFKF